MTAAEATISVTPSPLLAASQEDAEVLGSSGTKRDRSDTLGSHSETRTSAMREQLHASFEKRASFVGEPSHSIDPDLILPKCELPPRIEFEPVETFVAAAVEEQHQQKDDTIPLKKYKGILETFRFKNDPVMLHRLLLALRTAGNGSTLHLLTRSSSKHARLIHQIVRFNPFDLPSSSAEQATQPQMDYQLADAQLHLILALVSSNSVFLVPTLTSLWKMLTHQITDAPVESTRRIHAALAAVLRLCPKGKSELFPIIASNCPFRMRPQAELVWYYRQCLQVLRYIPSIEGQILELLVDKSLEMDVEIKINDGGEATIDDEQDDDLVFQLDMDEEAEKQDKPKLPADVTVDEMADKLDSLMYILFGYVEKTASNFPAATSSLYKTFARVFESSVLITHKSKFVQFLLLHVCGLESQALSSSGHGWEEEPVTLYRDFAARLIEVIVDPFRATVTRQTGACYLASFISRASFVCPETVCESVCALLRWAEAYVQSLDSLSVHAADARHQCSLHSLFYTVCQSAFYIMCFRGVQAIEFYRKAIDPVEAMDVELEQIDINSSRWTKLCGHSLQPLRYCLESVRSEFLHISKMYDLVDASVLEQLVLDDRRLNPGRQRKKTINRIKTAATLEIERRSGGIGGMGRGTNPLDSFFPFDPYLLCRSHRFIESFYKHWGDVADDAVDDDDDEPGFEGVPTDGEDDASEEDSVSEDDDDLANNRSSGSYLEPTSFASNATSVSSKSQSLGLGSSDLPGKREALHEAWTATLNGSRAASIENGSW